MAIENSELVQLALESSPSGVLMTNADGEILLVNHALENLFKYSRSELIGRRVEELIPERYRGAHGSLRDGFFHDPQSRVMGAGRELFGLRSDGSEVPVEIGLNPVNTPDGLCVLASVVDISARREAEFQLRESQKLEAIGTLASGIAHDFNNILLNILGYTELVRSQVPEGSNLADDLDQVISGTMRGKKLVERILSYSRHSSGEVQPLDPCKVVQEVLELLRASTPSSVAINSVLGRNVPRVLGEETVLHQLLMNLATNAVQAMPEGGELKVELTSVMESGIGGRDMGFGTDKKSLYMRLRVSDTGVGIDQEIKNRVFEPFFTTKLEGKGSGLGLAICHGIVESMNGWITIDSEPGRGTRIDVFLPALLETDTVLTESINEDKPETRGHILALDDEPVLARLLQRNLVRMGFTVSAFTSSLEALASFEESPQKFDMLITDNTMPDLTGMEMVNKVKSIRPELPILFLSGNLKPGSRSRIDTLNNVLALNKPYTFRELQDRIDQLYDRTLNPTGE